MSKPESTIGRNVQKYRKQLGISQDIPSKMANLAFHTVTKIEAGPTANPSWRQSKSWRTHWAFHYHDLMK